MSTKELMKKIQHLEYKIDDLEDRLNDFIPLSKWRLKKHLTALCIEYTDHNSVDCSNRSDLHDDHVKRMKEKGHPGYT